jgi:hypothetical protein
MVSAAAASVAASRGETATRRFCTTASKNVGREVAALADLAAEIVRSLLSGWPPLR